MDKKLDEEMNLQLSSKYLLHRFGNDLYIYDIQNDFDQAQLNNVEADIMFAMNRIHKVKSIWDELKKEYDIDDDDQEAWEVCHTFLQDLVIKEILVEGESDALILGDTGKYYPVTMAFELTNKCNLKCSHCYKEAQVQNHTFLSTELALKILRQIKGNVYHLEFTGGEATLHPDFERIVAASEVPSMVLLTNGSNLMHISTETLKRFESVQVSLYGTSQEEYKNIRTLWHMTKSVRESGDLLS